MCKLQRLFVLLILTCPLSNQAQLGYQLGDTVAIFSLPNADSAWVTPMQRDSAAQGIVLVFVSHGCSFSQAYEGRLADLGRKLPQFGFALYLVNSSPGPGEDLLAMRGHVLEKTFGNRYLKDEHQAIARAFGSAVSLRHLSCKELQAATTFCVIWAPLTIRSTPRIRFTKPICF
jgi:hypothetical protein